MDTNAWLIIVTIVLALVAALLAWWRASRNSYPRQTVLAGVGWVLLPIGLYLTGFLRLLWDLGVLVSRWAKGLRLDVATTIGLSLLGVAIVALVIAALMNARRDPNAPKPVKAPQPKKDRKFPSNQIAPAKDQPILGPAGLPIPTTTSSALELDNDVADILDQHGIK